MEAIDVVEVMLTADVYNETPELDENDLPPEVRKAAWNGEMNIERPIEVTEDFVEEAYGVDADSGEDTDEEEDGDAADTSGGSAWNAVSHLPFTDRDSLDGELRFTVSDLARDWYFENAGAERVERNPVLAYRYGDEFGVDYDEARSNNRPKKTDEEWIQSLVEEVVGDDEEAEETLELVEILAPGEIEQSLDEIVLTDEQKEEVEKVMKAIEYRDYLNQVGLSEIGKLLFVGPPGTGKTSTAKALSGRLDLPFIEVKLSMITSQYLGETAKNVDKVFELAKALSPCILFIDEFDSIAKTRESDEHAALKRAVNTLLKSIDEISLVRDSVLLIGATNHPQLLDRAVWRRFDEIVEFPAPDEEMRADIFEIITHGIEIEDFDPDELADKTEGLTGSDLRLVLREAVLNALTGDRTELTQQDLVDAVENFEKRKNLKEVDMMEEDSPIAGESDGHDHDHSQSAD
ncbi:MAG: ATP-binding protein [Halobacteria archaeon]|nr:ATP-binding protein [Halobacteria archaeon]